MSAQWPASSSAVAGCASENVAATPPQKIGLRVITEVDGRVVEREQELLARGELRHLDVDGAVREQPAPDREVELVGEVAREQLAADRVAHVVADEERRARARRAAATASAVFAWSSIEYRRSGLLDEPKPRKSKSTTSCVALERGQHVTPVERRAWEPVQHEDRVVPRGR